MGIVWCDDNVIFIVGIYMREVFNVNSLVVLSYGCGRYCNGSCIC